MKNIFGHRLAAAVCLVVLGAYHQGLIVGPAARWAALVAGVVGTLFVNVRSAVAPEDGTK